MKNRFLNAIVHALLPQRLSSHGFRQAFLRTIVDGLIKSDAQYLPSLVNPNDWQRFFRQVLDKGFARDREYSVHLLTEMAKATLTYSQEGEDLLLARFVKDIDNGFFVDVGAHHPVRFSNTYALYLNGWRGINVDATPGSMAAFGQLRPEDVNLECIVSDVSDPIRFHLFAESALNTCDDALASRYIDLGWESRGTIEVKPHTLEYILECYLPKGRGIDLMSIDVEGAEMQVLRSNDWRRFRPRVLIVEALDTSLVDLYMHPTIAFLREHGFTPMSKLANSVILVRQD